MKDVTKLLEFVKQIETNNKEAATYYQKISSLNADTNKLKSKLQEICHHPTTTKEHNYVEGGYYDRSCTTYWDQCTICGTKLNTRKEYGGYA